MPKHRTPPQKPRSTEPPAGTPSQKNPVAHRQTVLYLDQGAAHILLVMHAIIRTHTALQIQPLLSPERALAYLRRDAPFQDQTIYPFPAAILCDESLCRTRAADLLSRIRAIPGCRSLPIIIILGGEFRTGLIAAASEAGANHLLVKPLNADRLDKFVITLHACLLSNPADFTPLTTLAEYRPRPATLQI